MKAVNTFNNLIKHKSSSKNKNQTVIPGDGGLGTEFIKKDLNNKQAPFTYNLNKPELVANIHLDYLKAGSKIITTNTFSANQLYLKKDKNYSNLSTSELKNEIIKINKSGAKIAVYTRDNFIEENPDRYPALIAGSIGPTGSEEAIFPDKNSNQEKLVETFDNQIKALISGGVDLILFETFSYHLELKAGLEALEEYDLPAIVNMSFDNYTNTNYGTDIDDFANLINNSAKNKILAAGFNCITPEPGYQETIRSFIDKTEIPLSIYFNAGKPELNMKTGQTVYKSKDNYFQEIKSILKLNKPETLIIGGCCGTSPNTIRKLQKLI